MADLIVGNVNQGTGTRKLWRPGDTVVLDGYHTMLFGRMPASAEASDLELDLLQRRKLKSVGGATVSISRIIDGGICGFAMLDDIDNSVLDVLETFADLVGKDLTSWGNNFFMTMPHGSVLEVGDLVEIGYLSIFESLNTTDLRLIHDYQVRRLGPRFEVFPEDMRER